MTARTEQAIDVAKMKKKNRTLYCRVKLGQHVITQEIVFDPHNEEGYVEVEGFVIGLEVYEASGDYGNMVSVTIKRVDNGQIIEVSWNGVWDYEEYQAWKQKEETA